MEEFRIIKHLGQLTAGHKNKTLKTICTMPDPSGVYLKTDICFSINMCGCMHAREREINVF